MHLMFKCFYIPYYYSMLFGWMPIYIPKNNHDKGNKNTWYNVPGIVLSFSYVLLVVVSENITHKLMDAIKFQGNITSSNLTTHDRTQIIVGPMFLISLWINEIFIIVTFILMPFHLKGLRKVFDLFNDFFKYHGDMTTMNMLARKTNIESALLIILNTVLSILSVMMSFNRIRLSFALRLFIITDNVTKKLESLSLCIQFWCICSVLAKCFERLNTSLDKLRIRKNQVTAKPPDLFILPDRFTSPSNIVSHIKQLNRAHNDLCSILAHVNNVYQVLILLSLITYILSMLPHLFVLGIIMAYSNFRITPPISMIIWPLQYMMRVYIVCKAASIASNEGKRTKRLLNASFHKGLTEDEKNGIKRFSERIDSEKIRFSLYGLSHLDDEYFLSSVMAMGGYLIIIIQSYMTVIDEQYPIHDRPTADKFDE